MRNFTIHVMFSDTSPYGSVLANAYKPENAEYLVIVDLGQAREHNMPLSVIVAHEIGHALGNEFDLPGHVAVVESVRNKPSTIIHGTVLNQEKEAWEFAKIALGVERRAIGTYEQDAAYHKLMSVLGAEIV